MIEVAIAAAVVAGVGALLVGRRRRLRKAAEALPPPKERMPGAIELGDVLMLFREELWLAGEASLADADEGIRLFVAAGEENPPWIAIFGPERDVARLNAFEGIPDGKLPDRLPIAGRLLMLERRIAGELKIRGEHLPAGLRSGASTLTLFSDVGGRVLLVVELGTGSRLAFLGDRLSENDYEHLPTDANSRET